MIDISEMLAKIILWDIETVAENWKVDVKFVTNVIKEGKIPIVKISGIEKISVYHLYQYVEKHTYQYDELKKELKAIGDKEKNGNKNE